MRISTLKFILDYKGKERAIEAHSQFLLSFILQMGQVKFKIESNH